MNVSSLGHFEFHWKNAWRVWSNLSWQVFFIFAQELTKRGMMCIYFFLTSLKEKKAKNPVKLVKKIVKKKSWQPIWDTLYVLFIKFFNLIWNKRQIKKCAHFQFFYHAVGRMHGWFFACVVPYQALMVFWVGWFRPPASCPANSILPILLLCTMQSGIFLMEWKRIYVV